ncbi:RagB/SusD family nutrient uptake outer membrane protein [Tenacibaculum ovolyticum]|uniref:RagB/SusD family nutrient uptake outer membrane protein n=1 Tax=Tenacibaculum ovolyticum TaxID=104270 RepID=UPI0022F3C5EA|nr:RagB/SusD family nutrient uptake outer membrane protein [Tenacibaculum ovolyticum]WBX76806.1 RagB/SusD family nutrient uptake outer membrane protein [Tenacibaculum ovolyticum]
MLKNKIKFLFLSLTLSFLSCSDYLSEQPDNRTLIDSKEKISSLLIGAYPAGNYQLMAELMSDNVSEKITTGGDVIDLEMYQWLDTNLDTRDTPIAYWNSCYKAISQANQALASSNELLASNPEAILNGSLDLRPQMAEALIARAYAHFMLVNFWAKPYDPATASSDLGIPYVLEPETNLIKEYKRNSIEEVYNLIENDLLLGLVSLENSYQEPKFHFTKDAANAFATRFFLYKGDWAKAIEHANKVISNPSSEIRDMIANSNLTYSQNQRNYASALEATNLLVGSTSSLWARKFARSRFGLSNSKANELFFGGSGNPFGKGWAYGVFGNDQVFNLPKYEEYFKITNQSAGIGQPFLGIVLLDKDEVLLNRAEAYAMMGNYASSLNDLNTFLSKKTSGHDPLTDILTEDILTTIYPVIANEYTPFYTLTDKQSSFIKGIAEYRRREYYHEGLRWFDVKRYQLEVTHIFDGSPIVLAKKDNRKELQIPQTAQNFGVSPNPR